MELEQKYSKLSDRISQLTQEHSEHTKDIAVLKTVIENIDKSVQKIADEISSLNKRLDKINSEYLMVQGSLKVFSDFKDNIEDHENRVRSLEKFIEKLKGKIFAYSSFGGVASGIIASLITAFLVSKLM